MAVSAILCTTHISKTSIRFRSSTRKTTIRRFQKNALRGPFPKNLCFGLTQTPFCVAFSAPDPPGGLSMRTRRLWDTGFEVLDFRTSARFRFKSNLEDPLLKALNHLNLRSLTLRQEQVNAIRNRQIRNDGKS